LRVFLKLYLIIHLSPKHSPLTQENYLKNHRFQQRVRLLLASMEEHVKTQAFTGCPIHVLVHPTTLEPTVKVVKNPKD
jgi:hypothetical protein